MSDRAEAIMDAAERRIRNAGYSGFSFREIAADVGVKSASVHYHFPTKDALAAAVARRYNARIATAIDDAVASGANVLDAWREVFRSALNEGARMCLCGALGTATSDLGLGVATEVQRFFDHGIKSLMAGGLSREQAMQAFATLEGAILIASVHGDAAMFDAATTQLQ